MPAKTAVPSVSDTKPQLNRLRQLRLNPVVLMFVLLCTAGIPATGLSLTWLAEELVARMARNSFLVLSLLIPVSAGMGLNFSIVLGAMAAQAAIIAVTHWHIEGIGGLLLAAVLATPVAILLGYLVGQLFNKAKGREMITGMIAGFFANGVYQLVFLFGVGTIIPMKDDKLMLPSGIGMRSVLDLKGIRMALDNLVPIWPGGIKIPIMTFVVIALLAWGITKLMQTKLGQDFRAVGQDMSVAAVSGINVDRTRIIAIILSTVLAAWGQLIFIQNIGTLNVFNSHEQVGTFAIASLLVGGASASRATIGQALLGTLLFHTLFVVSPRAGQSLLGSAQIGEYFRVFIAYGVIAVALALHAWESKKK